MPRSIRFDATGELVSPAHHMDSQELALGLRKLPCLLLATRTKRELHATNAQIAQKLEFRADAILGFAIAGFHDPSEALVERANRHRFLREHAAGA